MRWRAECKNGNSGFYTFWVIPLWTFVHHKNCVCSITSKPLKLYSRNFIQISISMRWHAECKNGNSSIFTFWVTSLGTLCITKNRVHSITWKPLKLYSRNYIQISISMRWCGECKNGNSAFYTFWVIFLGTLSITKTVSALENLETWKPLKLYSRNFIQVSTIMNQRAECKNSNCVIYTLWVISLGLLSITKQLSKTILYQVMIVQV